MNQQARIESAIAAATGKHAGITESRAVAGGCINDGRIVTLDDGRRYFVKTHPGGDVPGMFAVEFRALELLAGPGVLHVPAPVAWDEDFLVMEVFDEGRPAPDWAEQMGRRLARLHLATRTERFGFERDNYLGSTLQPNAWRDTWLEFWREQRLGWQLKMFSEKTGKDDELLVLGARVLGRLDALIGHIDEPAVLLHGDLWSGNAAADERGEPVIFDPASYYGNREAEIGMMRLFGGFGPACEAAYAEVWPFESGLEGRIPVYRLYHELNHLNLFGAGYYQRCLATLRSLL